MNSSKQEDRDQIRSEREDEIAAVDAGEWPRNLNDRMRWSKGTPEWAKQMCQADIAYIDDLETRLDRGEKPWG
jgi:hypothetical protein